MEINLIDWAFACAGFSVAFALFAFGVAVLMLVWKECFGKADDDD